MNFLDEHGLNKSPLFLGLNEHVTGRLQGTVNELDPVSIEVVEEIESGVLDAVLPGYINWFDFSSDGLYKAVGHFTSPKLTIFKKIDGVYTKLPDPVDLPSPDVYTLRFSPDDVYLAVGLSASPYLMIYKRSGDVFTKLTDPVDMPTSYLHSLDWGINGDYLCLGMDSSPYIVLYSRSGDVFTKLADPATLPTGAVYDVRFSPNGDNLAVGHNISPFLTVYKRSGDVFTKTNDPSILPGGRVQGLDWSSDNYYIALGVSGPPYVETYELYGTNLYKATDPAVLPGTGCYMTRFYDNTHVLTVCDDALAIKLYSVMYGNLELLTQFAAVGLYTYVADFEANSLNILAASDPSYGGEHLYMYEHKEINLVTKTSDVDDLSTQDGLGYAEEGGVINDEVNIIILARR